METPRSGAGRLLQPMIEARWPLRYALAVAATLTAFFLRLALRSYLGPPYILFYPTVLLAALIGGGRVGVLVTGLSSLLAAGWILPSERTGPPDTRELVSLVAFALIGLFMSWVAHVHRDLRLRLVHLEAEAALQRAEARVRQREEQLRLFVEHAPAAIAMFDREMRYLAVSRRFAADYGLPAGDLLGRSHYDVFPEIPDRVRAIHQRALGGQSERCDEEPFPRADGRVDWVRWEVCPWRTVEGEVGGIILFSEVITARKEAEARVERERERLSVTLESIADAVIATDASGHVTVLNDVASRLTGWPRAEAIGRPVGEVFHIISEETRQVAPSPVDRVLRDGLVVGLANHTALVARDGAEHPIADSAAPILDATGRNAGVVLVFRDQTKERRDQAALRESEGLLRGITEAIPDPIFLKDREGRWQFINRAALSVVGRPSSEVLGKTDAEVYGDPGVAGPLMETDARIMASGVAEMIEEPIRTADGDLRVFLSSKVPYRSPSGEIVGVVGVAHDITDRKRALEALRERDHLLSESQRIAHVGTWTWDPFTDAIRWSDETYRIHGARPGAFEPTPEVFLAMKHRDDRAAAEAWLRACAAGERPTELGVRIVRPDGEVRTVAWRGELVPGGKPGRARLVGTVQDVTDQRAAEEARRAADRRYRDLVELSPDAVVVVRADRVEFVNPAAVALFGAVRPDGVLDKDLSELFDAEVQRRLRDEAEGLTGEVAPACRSRISRLDGTTRDVDVASAAFRDERGIAVQVVLHDVTEQMAAERRLEARERALRTILETSLDGFMVVGHDGAVYEANAAACLISGYEHGELLTLRVQDFAAEHPSAVAARIDTILERGAARFESRLRRREGGLIDVELSIQLADLGEGRMVAFFRDITREKRAREALLHSEARFRALIEKSTDMTIVLDAEGRYRFWSPSAEETLGSTAAEKLGTPSDCDVHPEDLPRIIQTRARLVADPSSVARERLRVRRKDGTWCSTDSTARNLVSDPAVGGVVINLRDVTEQRALEAQFWEAQKLESIGRLAGGVAHDFNNLLTVILSGADDLRRAVAPAGGSAREILEDVVEAGRRGRDLTRQLLAFARKQVIAPEAIALDEVVRGTEKLLRRLLDEDVELETSFAPGLWPIRCDRGQAEQVLMNLAVNARDAMPSGGRLRIEISNEAIADGAPPGARAGAWVRLRVRDSGTGMTPEVRTRLFEPFFTTKPQGKGTGLGLATVYGIVKQNDGFITVESELGRGTAFDVYFPRVEGPLSRPSAAVAATTTGGHETVLVVEDDRQVQRVTVRALESAGYRVFVANDGVGAREVAEQIEGPLHLLVTDIVMPGESGRVVAERLRLLRPRLRVLYVSGYTHDEIVRHGVLDAAVDFLEKPFTPEHLVARVRAILDRSAPVEPGA